MGSGCSIHARWTESCSLLPSEVGRSRQLAKPSHFLLGLGQIAKSFTGAADVLALGILQTPAIPIALVLVDSESPTRALCFMKLPVSRDRRRFPLILVVLERFLSVGSEQHADLPLLSAVKNNEAEFI